MDSKIVEILLVEDNRDDVELTLRALEKDNLAKYVHVVRDGLEALEFLFGEGQNHVRRENPKAILLDLKLPRVDGLEVLKRVRADKRTCDVPVVILTSSREGQDLKRSYRLGANSYVVKPVDWAQFTDDLRQVAVYWLVLNQTPDTTGGEVTR